MSFNFCRAILCLAFTLVLCASVEAQDLDSGLITHFKFDEVSGSTAFDSSESNFDSQVLGGTQWADGFHDGAIEFNGLDAKIALGQPEEYNISSYSIACWFKNDDASEFRVMSARNSHWQNRQWWLTIWQIGYSSGRDAKLVFRMSPQSGNYVDLVSSTRVDDNEWHAAVVTIDSSNGGTAKLYLDNVLQHTITGFGTPKIPNATAYVGRDISGSRRFYKGMLDDFRIYNRVLSTEEVALFSEPPPPIYYVRKRGSDSNDGLSPQTSFRTIQKAINNCTRAGSTVYVGPGTYNESIKVGTGAGATAVSGTADNPTQLIADLTGANTFDDPGAVLIGAVVSEPNGMTISNIEHWTIEGFTLQDQTSYGIYATNTALSITDCTFDVPSTFAIYAMVTDNTSITGCTFNRTTTSGSSIWVQAATGAAPDSIVVSGNDLTLKGDLYQSIGYENGFSYSSGDPNQTRYIYGIIVLAWNTSIGNVEISNNQVSDYYLPILSLVSSTSGDSTITNNTVTGSLYSIYNYTYRSGSAQSFNNIIDSCYYGLIAVNYQGGTSTVSGLLEHNITGSMAQFRRSFEFDILTGSPRFTDAASGDFSLQRGSPAIDAGTSSGAPSIDIAGNSRPNDGDDDGISQIDLGAYELVTEPTRARIVQWRELGIDRDR